MVLQTYTLIFNSESHDTISWLDHCIATHNGHKLVDTIHVINKFICSDHLPLSIVINIVINMIPYM